METRKRKNYTLRIDAELMDKFHTCFINMMDIQPITFTIIFATVVRGF